MVDFGTNDMKPHLIFCVNIPSFVYESDNLKEIIWKKMREYGIQSSILTMLCMERVHLITKEKSKLAAEGKLKNEPEFSFYQESINEDLDSFIDKLQNSNEIRDEKVWSFCTPKLTKKELKLVEQKNKEHMMNYNWKSTADVDVEEMKKSDSKDKYVLCYCHRETVHLTLESNLE